MFREATTVSLNISRLQQCNPAPSLERLQQYYRSCKNSEHKSLLEYWHSKSILRTIFYGYISDTGNRLLLLLTTGSGTIQTTTYSATSENNFRLIVKNSLSDIFVLRFKLRPKFIHICNLNKLHTQSTLLIARYLPTYLIVMFN